MKQVEVKIGINYLKADELTENQMDKLVGAFAEVIKGGNVEDIKSSPPVTIKDQSEKQTTNQLEKKSSNIRLLNQNTQGNIVYSSDKNEDETNSPFGHAFTKTIFKQMEERGAVERPFTLDPTNIVDPIQPVTDRYAETQDFHVTGIKYRNINGVSNVPHYRTRYECPECGTKGNHYVPEGTPEVTCHECKTQLEVEEATSIGFPNKDEWNNFYVANNKVEA